MTFQELNTFKNSEFKVGASIFKRLFWYFLNALVFNSYLFPFYGLKRSLLRLFGARIGRSVVVKPKVNIKYPWKLGIGNYSWIGEKVWIDNLDLVDIGANVCVSQGALILSGNHNFKKKSFDLLTKPIIIEEGAWIGAKSVVTQGIVIPKNSVLTVASVASNNMEEAAIYRGNPAVKVSKRILDED